MKPLFNTKIQLIILLAIFIVSFLIFSGTNSLEQIPEEEPAALNTLKKAITLSKTNTDLGIKILEELNNLSDYTNYKRKYILAKLYEKKNDLNKALSIYEEISSKNYPLKERTIFHCARLNLKLGEDTKALRLINKLLHNFPNSKTVPQAKYLLAQTQLRLRLTPQAINTLNSLRSEFPDTQFGIATNYYLGEHAYNNKNYTEAIKYWREYLTQSPDGRFANEISDFLESNKLFNLEKADFTLLGNVFFHNKSYKKAAAYYTMANDKKDFYNLGYSLYRLSRKNEAARYLTEYAKEFTKAENVRFSLYYAATCTPSYLRKLFWERMTKEIPTLAYYTEYKKAMSEISRWQREKDLKDFIKSYPESLFIGNAVWELMWLNIREKKFGEAEKIGEDYILAHKSPPEDNPEMWAKITFWLGKISEIKNKKDKAKEYYAFAKNTLEDNYYSFRAQERYSALTGLNDNFWKLKTKIYDYTESFWSIPNIISNKAIKEHFGTAVLELINLEEYEEAMDLIGRTQAPSKQVGSYLKALNNEYDDSINTAAAITLKNKIPITNPIWELAYPLHFWHFIYESARNYPDIDPLFVCSVIRQESRFDRYALSISDAYGLMQIIPPTARTLARQLNTSLNGNDSLYNPRLNILLGTKYLDDLIKDFNNPLFAVASYNAGPQSVKRWLLTFKHEWSDRPDDLDFFVEEIPYAQTKEYAIKVFSNYWTYLKLYKK